MCTKHLHSTRVRVTLQLLDLKEVVMSLEERHMQLALVLDSSFMML